MPQTQLMAGSSSPSLLAAGGTPLRARAFAGRTGSPASSSWTTLPAPVARACAASPLAALMATQAPCGARIAPSVGMGALLASERRGAQRCHSSSTETSNVTSSGGVAQRASTGAPASAAGAAKVPCDQASWDLDWFHYTPAWYKPHILIIAALSFVVGCNLATEPSLKTTIIASAPVTFGLFIFLYVIPRQFKDFAKQYIATHPECEEHARSKQRLEQEQHRQEQLEQQQQQRN